MSDTGEKGCTLIMACTFNRMNTVYRTYLVDCHDNDVTITVWGDLHGVAAGLVEGLAIEEPVGRGRHGRRHDVLDDNDPTTEVKVDSWLLADHWLDHLTATHGTSTCEYANLDPW